MNIAKQRLGLSKKLMALALLAAFNPVHAEEGDDIAQFTKPGSSASIGLGTASGNSKERALFGQYNGMRQGSFYGLLDIDAVNRDDATGTWTTLDGRNLGLSDRELLFSQEKQGDWKYFAEYNQLTRYYPRTVNTGLQGAGTTTPTVVLLGAPGTGTDLDLKTKREGTSVGLEKWLTRSLQVEASFKNEDKDGARLWGRGFNCPSGAAPSPACTTMGAGVNAWALLMLPEPINSNTKQFEAKLNFSGEKLALTGGYYGSFYRNAYGALTPTVPDTLNDPLGTPTTLNAGLRGILGLPMALPPDNQAHQFYLFGNYAFTPATRGTFKVAYTHATQKDDFAGNGFTGPSGVSNYGGVVDTTLAQLGLTARPIPKLSVNANLRYEDREDKSPLQAYNLEGANPFTNGTYSLKRTNAKLEGSYRLPANLRGTLGVDYEAMNRGQYESPECINVDPSTCLGDSVAGISGVRAKTWETGYRAELRRTMTETFSGAISYAQSTRNGSNWLKPNALPATGTTEQTDGQIYSRTAIFPSIFMDRDRRKLRLSTDWSATERLSLQFFVEDAKDEYSAPTSKGFRDSSNLLYSVDAALTLSEAWKMTGYWSLGDQTLHVDHSTGYMADIRNLNTSLGIGVIGKASPRIEVGGDLSYISDGTIYDQGLDSAASATNIAFLAQSGGLPDVTFRQLRLKLFGKYALEKNSAIRVDLVYQRSQLNEWTWGSNGVPFVYSDNTTVTIDPDQRVAFIGATYIYKWQ